MGERGTVGRSAVAGEWVRRVGREGEMGLGGGQKRISGGGKREW